MKTLDEINRLIAATEAELAELESSRSILLSRVAELQHEKSALLQPSTSPDFTGKSTVTNQSSQDEKIALFRSLFRGREDIYPRRFESLKTGKQGYQPVCQNEWIRGVCERPKIRCEDCGQREFLPVTDLVVKSVSRARGYLPATLRKPKNGQTRLPAGLPK